MNLLSYKEFSDMEKAHAKGKLIKICKNCGCDYKPELRTYKKYSYKIGSKSRTMVVGNWFLSEYCNGCFNKIKVAKRRKRE